MLVPVKVVRQWIEELKSGKHIQTKGCLQKQLPSDQMGNCCLGILAKLGTGTFEHSIKDYEKIYVLVQNKKRLWTTLPDDYFSDYPNFKKEDVINIDQEDLVKQNDFNELKFEEIAKYLETKLK